MSAKVCAECGQIEDLHHAFVAKMPDGCQCDAGEWGDKITPICGRKRAEILAPRCADCEHDQDCHSE